jgi:hypothetical protein
MKKFLALIILCLPLVMASADDRVETGQNCLEAVTLQYGADLPLDGGDPYWIRLKVGEFDQKGISAFWYSSDSLFLEAYYAIGNPKWGSFSCNKINLSIMSAPNANIIIEAGELMAKVEAQMAKQDDLTEDFKENIRSSFIYLELTPRSKDGGRFILNEFGIAAGSDCDNPWVVALGAVYGLTEDQNVFRFNPMELDTLHVSYEPMRKDDKDFTAMNVQVHFGSCNGPIVQSGKSLKGVDEGLFVPRKSLLDSAVTLNQPLFFVVTRESEPATIAFRRVRSDERRVNHTVCPNQPITLGDITVSEPGEYDYYTRSVDGEFAVYHHNFATVALADNCEDALENVYDMSVVVCPTAAMIGQDIEIIADGANHLDVYDITGRRVQALDFTNNASIRLGNSGQFFVRISGTKHQTRKIVVF